jgi:hypothetical protein
MTNGKGDVPRRTLVSDEEHELRWNLFLGNIVCSDEEFAQKVKEIRERTGKP